MAQEIIAASLVNIVILLLFGIFISIVLERYNSKKFIISNLLVLVLVGIVLSVLPSRNAIFQLDRSAVAALSTVAVVIVVFHAAFSLKLSELDSSYRKATARFILFFILNMIFLPLCSLLIFGQELGYSVYLGFILAALMTSISPNLCFTKTDKYLSKAKIPVGRVFSSIRTEAAIGLPILLLLAFILAGFAQADELVLATKSFSIIYSLLIGISIGMLMAVLVLVIVRSKYSEFLSSIFLAIAALMSYVIAEQLNGNGIAAVAALGLFYSSIYVKNREMILEHSSAAMFILETIVFVMAAFVINLNVSFVFILKVLALFIIYLGIRFVAVFVLHNAKMKEVIFLTLQVPKGLSVIVVIVALSNFNISNIDNMLSIALYFVLLSHIISLIVTHKAGHFLPEYAGVKAPLEPETIETKIEKEKKELVRGYREDSKEDSNIFFKNIRNRKKNKRLR